MTYKICRFIFNTEVTGRLKKPDQNTIYTNTNLITSLCVFIYSCLAGLSESLGQSLHVYLMIRPEYDEQKLMLKEMVYTTFL